MFTFGTVAIQPASAPAASGNVISAITSSATNGVATSVGTSFATNGVAPSVGISSATNGVESSALPAPNGADGDYDEEDDIISEISSEEKRTRQEHLDSTAIAMEGTGDISTTSSCCSLC